MALKSKNETIYPVNMSDALDEIRGLFISMRINDNNGFCIPLEKIYQWLELSFNAKEQENLLKRYLRNDNYGFLEAEDKNDIDAHFFIQKQERKHFIWFSNDGFKMLCILLNKSKRSKFILKYFIQLEKDYIRALKSSPQENAKEINRLNKIIRDNQKIYEDQVENSLNLEFKIMENTERLNSYEHFKRLTDVESFDNTELEVLTEFMRIYTKKVGIYLYNTDEYKMYVYNLCDLNNAELDNFYFYVGDIDNRENLNTDFTWVTSLGFLNTDHYNDFICRLEECLYYKGVYLVNWSYIKNAHMQSLLRSLKRA
jgi:hypothetical protein